MPDDVQQPTQPVKEKPVEAAPTAVAAVHNNPGVLVLQWLTYAFWGWTILALAWLTAISVGFFINPDSLGGEESSVVAYSLAAVIVLFAISLICDAFYSRIEPLQKHGGATVIMIIHAVIFALFGIGALITAVFAVVRLLIGDGGGSGYGDSGAVTTLITGLIIAAVYGATLLRTLRPFKLKRSALFYWIFMTIVTGTITTLAIVGPTWHARVTRDDRLIERNLAQLSEAISIHAREDGKLPTALSEVRDELEGEAVELIDRNLVEYKPGDKVAPNASDLPLGTNGRSAVPAPDATVFEYTLCVTYKAKNGSNDSYPAYAPEGRQVTPETYRHDAGRVCYDLQTSYGYTGKLY
jgi:hypothetical protein